MKKVLLFFVQVLVFILPVILLVGCFDNGDNGNQGDDDQNPPASITIDKESFRVLNAAEDEDGFDLNLIWYSGNPTATYSVKIGEKNAIQLTSGILSFRELTVNQVNVIEITALLGEVSSESVTIKIKPIPMVAPTFVRMSGESNKAITWDTTENTDFEIRYKGVTINMENQLEYTDEVAYINTYAEDNYMELGQLISHLKQMGNTNAMYKAEVRAIPFFSGMVYLEVSDDIQNVDIPSNWGEMSGIIQRAMMSNPTNVHWGDVNQAELIWDNDLTNYKKYIALKSPAGWYNSSLISVGATSANISFEPWTLAISGDYSASLQSITPGKEIRDLGAETGYRIYIPQEPTEWLDFSVNISFLARPSNFRIENSELVWDAIDNAFEYVVATPWSSATYQEAPSIDLAQLRSGMEFRMDDEYSSEEWWGPLQEGIITLYLYGEEIAPIVGFDSDGNPIFNIPRNYDLENNQMMSSSVTLFYDDDNQTWSIVD